MFIQTENTPNPEALKFIPGVPVLETGTATFTDAKAAKNSPLAEALFTVPEVRGIYLGADFITVTKSAESEWNLLKPSLLSIIMDHFVSGKPVILNTDNAVESSDGGDSEIVNQIKELIETRVRPAVAQDGGDIVFRGFDDGIVKLELHGSCSGCPSSTATLKDGIENMLKHYVPEVVGVEAVQ